MTKKQIKEKIAEKERHWQRCEERKCFMLADKLSDEIETLEKLLTK